MSNTLFTIKFYQLQHYSSGKNLLQNNYLMQLNIKQFCLLKKIIIIFFNKKKMFDIFFTCQIIIISDM